MVEERPLSDADLDAALTEAFAVDPAPDFVARVRRRVAEEPRVHRRLQLFGVAASVAAGAIVFVTMTLEHKPVAEQPPTRKVTAAAPARALPPAPPVAAIAATDRRNRGRDKLQKLPTSEVLIPAAEQQALRRLLERPPKAVLRFPAAVVEEPAEVAGIVIPPLEIDPLSTLVEEGGRQ
jgi:hypothetical protein